MGRMRGNQGDVVHGLRVAIYNHFVAHHEIHSDKYLVSARDGQEEETFFGVKSIRYGIRYQLGIPHLISNKPARIERSVHRMIVVMPKYMLWWYRQISKYIKYIYNISN